MSAAFLYPTSLGNFPGADSLLLAPVIQKEVGVTSTSAATSQMAGVATTSGLQTLASSHASSASSSGIHLAARNTASSTTSFLLPTAATLAAFVTTRRRMAKQVRRAVQLRSAGTGTTSDPVKPHWLGAGLEELSKSYAAILVDEDALIIGGTPLPWAIDCLEELGRCGIARVVLLRGRQDPSEPEPKYLELGKHFDAALPLTTLDVIPAACELASWHLKSPDIQEGRLLLVGADEALVQAVECDETMYSVDTALVCSTPGFCDTFGLHAAPNIDVPANGGKFVEPRDDCW
eukprot:CAMPEP_0206432308 /NCGR_PEP_ID=MMETSP0324_2-20121206/7848_1 /ASSEMBLY_ACC=CAM_ASM_000836 /TAXON_ID=2866 /ORGANISM="Crypthecodinium cohnii, Strain Seligo" /LENGTH=290 /DNA_ID=CAMNT_0053898333 /DNA_START=25 /DNA_END=894 /DNA_ORIENTATION=-